MPLQQSLIRDLLKKDDKRLLHHVDAADDYFAKLFDEA